MHVQTLGMYIVNVYILINQTPLTPLLLIQQDGLVERQKVSICVCANEIPIVQQEH